MTTSSTLQKKPHPEQSISFPTQVINFRSADLTVSLVIYIATKARRRRRSAAMGRLSGLRPLLTGTMNSSGSISPWRGYFSTKTSSTPRTLTSNMPSHMRSMVNTVWAARLNCRLGFCAKNAGSRRRSLRLYVLLTCSRILGLQRIWRGVETSFGILMKGSRPLPENRILTVSPWRLCHVPHSLTLYSQLEIPGVISCIPPRTLSLNN